ncbi:GNAT family N-acetyltransferase [Paludisphaera soli]|uniref:GNAT family N-acetyltransferase n=1 Tax=Paludisphaera soli TaxID=2712865 RepID=UPI00197D330F|nr:GNAT family N-acetyltransferase [Paludisphaera soli]
MPTLVIPTPRLDLILQTPDQVLAWVESLPPEVRAEVSPDWVARVHSTPPGDPWSLSYAVEERAGRAVVGGCAFKGPPDADGVVELAYGVDEEYRGRGYATEAAAALAGFALADGRVRVVRAHTRPEYGSSARVLVKCGFTKLGEVVDPEDGLVWRWERVRESP